MTVSRGLYIDLIKKVVANTIYEDSPVFAYGVNPLDQETANAVKVDDPRSLNGKVDFQKDHRVEGVDIPSVAHTQIGMKRLDNLDACVRQVLADGVPGDFIETGVWRGGACVLMRAILKAYDVRDRDVWLADTFEGMPEIDSDGHPLDQGMEMHNLNWVLACSLEQVRENLSRYGLLDEQVRFLQGLFSETLPKAPIDKLAILRLDGDLYGSTMDALVNLYPKLSVGGYIIIDDYVIPACREAVHDYRREHGIDEEIETIDVTGVYWRRKV